MWLELSIILAAFVCGAICMLFGIAIGMVWKDKQPQDQIPQIVKRFFMDVRDALECDQIISMHVEIGKFPGDDEDEIETPDDPPYWHNSFRNN